MRIFSLTRKHEIALSANRYSNLHSPKEIHANSKYLQSSWYRTQT